MNTGWKLLHRLKCHYGFFVGIVSLILLLSCEKDDICVDGDTPLLIVTFYNSLDPELLQTVTKLRVIGIDNGNPVNTFADRSSLDSIGIPLRADTNRTGFVFYRDSASDENGNEIGNPDTLYFDYTVNPVFISRACGFVPNFDEFSSTYIPDDSPWIDSLQVTQTQIANSTASHVSIFF